MYEPLALIGVTMHSSIHSLLTIKYIKITKECTQTPRTRWRPAVAGQQTGRGIDKLQQKGIKNKYKHQKNMRG